MGMQQRVIGYLFCFILLLFGSCTHKPGVADTTGSNYPEEVRAIILNKCAVSGCHNDLSYNGADGLNLTTWDKMFKGSGTGAVVIPYRPDFSSLCYFANTYTDLGIALQPTMPVGQPPLSRTEYLAIKNWITSGAPSAQGAIKFSPTSSAKKIYVANRLCNVVTVLDAASLLQMRYIDVGSSTVKFPYRIKVAADKANWYVSFFTQSDFVQQFSTVNDSLVSNINIGLGSWTSFEITSDSKYGYFVDNSNPGKVVCADLVNGTVLATYTFGGKFIYPTGIAINESLKKLYIGTTTGNFIYSVNIADPLAPVISEIPIDGTGTAQYSSSLNPMELLLDAATNNCYIACAGTNEIRVVNMQGDSVSGIIPVGSAPAFMDYSQALQKLFVSCPDDETTFPGNRGSVVVIDAQTTTVDKRLNTGYQPYGISADDRLKIVTVVNANISSSGPASHHVSNCGQKNGNVTFIDYNTLELIPGKRLEVAVFPFGAATK